MVHLNENLNLIFAKVVWPSSEVQVSKLLGMRPLPCLILLPAKCSLIVSVSLSNSEVEFDAVQIWDSEYIFGQICPIKEKPQRLWEIPFQFVLQKVTASKSTLKKYAFWGVFWVFELTCWVGWSEWVRGWWWLVGVGLVTGTTQLLAHPSSLFHCATVGGIDERGGSGQCRVPVEDILQLWVGCWSARQDNIVYTGWSFGTGHPDWIKQFTIESTG